LDKSINSLLGIVEGISVDSVINGAEIQYLNLWLDDHQEFRNRHPYQELLPVVQSAVHDGVLSSEEKDDIVWLCEKMRSTQYFSEATADLQRLHALLGGVASDGVISERELRGLSDWLSEHEHLKKCWPYEEVASLITGVLADKKITDVEHELLKEFFGEFVPILDDRTITSPKLVVKGALVGLCAVCPDITFSEKIFCFTGTSSKYTRAEFSNVIRNLGGEVANSVSTNLDYLIIGADGNPCWAFACYGRKVEKAIELRRAGAQLLLVHENDFHDAVSDM